MNNEQDPLTAKVETATCYPLPVDHDVDAEAATQPKRPSVGQEQSTVFNGKNKTGSQKTKGTQTIFYVLFVLFAMAVTGVVVYFVMDARNPATSNSATGIMEESPSTSSPDSTAPPAPTSPSDPSLEIIIGTTEPLGMCQGGKQVANFLSWMSPN